MLSLQFLLSIKKMASLRKEKNTKRRHKKAKLLENGRKKTAKKASKAIRAGKTIDLNSVTPKAA